MIFSNHKIIEVNAKYHRPPAQKWLLKFKEQNVRFHLGSDAHSLQEIGNFFKISDLIALVHDNVRKKNNDNKDDDDDDDDRDSRYHRIRSV